jgi:asparagine synthase (glutamine-hydrolysing)
VIPKGLRLASAGDKAHKLAGYLSARSREHLYLRTLSHWANPSSVVVGCHEPASVLNSISECSWLSSFEEAMMLTDLLNYLPDDILTKVDRASMAVSLEARVPILDHRVVEFAWRLPLSFKIRNKSTKWILRQVLYKYVPKDLVERPKMGFAVPIGSWLRGPLRDWAEDLLGESSLRRHELFHVQPIRTKWQEHLSGTRNWHHSLWDVLIFQDWLSKISQSSKIAAYSC